MLSNALCCVNKISFPGLASPPKIQVIRSDISQFDFSTMVSDDNFQNEPSLKYLFPENEMRRTLLPPFFSSIARSEEISGEVYTADAIEGGVLFVTRGDRFRFERLVVAALDTAPFKLDWPALRRIITLCTRLDGAHERLVIGPHWYVWFIGPRPSQLGSEIAAAMLQPLLSRADSTGTVCYLETFHQAELPFFRSFGFRVEGAGKIPGDGPSFWAMLRMPR